jgi:drug/metabolite transporter (DMT)-like permease
MTKIKVILFLAFVFFLAIAFAFYFENSYRILVRFFFNFFQGGQIKFIGKDFHLFASPFLLVSFGLFCVLLSLLLLGQRKKGRLFYSQLPILLFFITTMVTTYLDSTSKIIGCTICKDGEIRLQYNTINYDFHFITSLVVGLLPLLLAFFKKRISKR